MRADIVATILYAFSVGAYIITSVHDDLSPLTRTSVRCRESLVMQAFKERAPVKSARMIFMSALMRACAWMQWMAGDSPNWMKHGLIHKVRHRLINECWEWWDNGACRAIAYRFDWIVLLSTDRYREKKKSFGKYERLMTHTSVTIAYQSAWL